MNFLKLLKTSKNTFHLILSRSSADISQKKSLKSVVFGSEIKRLRMSKKKCNKLQNYFEPHSKMTQSEVSLNFIVFH